MKKTNPTTTEAEEIKFFDNYYKNEACNPLGWRNGTLGRMLSLGSGDGQFELLLAPWAKLIPALFILAKRIS
jgi:hypothetical protein